MASCHQSKSPKTNHLTDQQERT